MVRPHTPSIESSQRIRSQKLPRVMSYGINLYELCELCDPAIVRILRCTIFRAHINAQPRGDIHRQRYLIANSRHPLINSQRSKDKMRTNRRTVLWRRRHPARDAGCGDFSTPEKLPYFSIIIGIDIKPVRKPNFVLASIEALPPVLFELLVGGLPCHPFSEAPC